MIVEIIKCVAGFSFTVLLGIMIVEIIKWK